jgi:hypothetical protein
MTDDDEARLKAILSKELNDLADRVKAAYMPFLDQLDRDNHSFGDRPCATCQAVTAFRGKPFGCVRVAERKRG